MAQPRFYEGTWEEITERLRDETAEGRRFKVIVMPEETDAPQANGIEGQNLADALADLLEEAKHVQRETPVPHDNPHLPDADREKRALQISALALQGSRPQRDPQGWLNTVGKYPEDHPVNRYFDRGFKLL